MAGVELSFDALVRHANNLQTDYNELTTLTGGLKGIASDLQANGGFKSPRSSQLFVDTNNALAEQFGQMSKALTELRTELERVKTDQEQRDQQLSQDIGSLRSDR